jgi:enterochelin esterase-like enzyme
MGARKGELMARAAAAALTVVLLSAGHAFAQGTLKVGEPIDRAITAGATHEYVIALDAGDYVAGAVDQRGILVLAAVFTPDGSRLRNFGGPREGKRTVAFIAERAGTYRLELRAPSIAEAAQQGGSQSAQGTYELKLLERLSFDERMKAPPPRDRYTSPAIEALRKQIADGDRSTESFWQRVAQSGTPLVEPIDGDAQRTRVTFLWRATAPTRNVMVLGSFMTGPPTDYAMTRLADTDVWYLTVRLPSGSRFAYSLSPNDPQAFDPPRAAQRAATVQGDPLNPRRWGCSQPTATRHDCQTMAELPGAPPQPWIVRNDAIPAGKVEKHKIASDLLKNERNLSVYTPPDYRSSGKPYPLLVLFDEGAYLNQVPTPVILDNLIAAGKIPPMVAVLIANPSQDARNKELPPNPQFADFLATELLPWIHARYIVTSDPKLTTVGGSSYGGIAATYAGLRHSEIFGNVLCQSGSFWWAPDHGGSPDVDATTETGWLAKEFIKSRTLPLKFWMDAGVFEVDSRGNGGAILEPSRHMRDVLLAKGYDVRYQQFNSGHDYLNWRGTLADGLIALVGTDAARATSR